MTILIVDDEAIQVKGMSSAMGQMCRGAAIRVATDGQEALNILKNESIDVVFADIKMPNMDGLEMLQAWRNLGHASEMPPYFIFISGYDEFRYAQTAIRYGAIDYLLKPLDMHNLSRVIQRVAATVGLKKPVSESDMSDQIMRQVREYLLEHMHERLSLEEIACKFSYHPNYLSNMWRRKTEITLMTYLQNLRLERAEQLLLETQLKVADIAQMVGYGDEKYFCRVFKAAHQLSPNAFRRQRKAGTL